MASGDVLDLFTGYSSTTAVFRLQMQKSSGVYEVRISARNDSGSWVDSAWYALATGWNAIEINYLPGHLTGQMSLWVGGTLKQTLSTLDNETSTIDSVRLGAQGVDTGTRGTLYFDDFDSHRFSAIGLRLPPGSQNIIPTPEPGFSNAAYAYDSERPQAFTSVDRGAGTDTFAYDENGNTPALHRTQCGASVTCRVEGDNTYNQVYNADCEASRRENRLYLAQLMKTGISCPSANTVAPANDVTASWTFTYDGDGTRVKQVYTTYVEPFVSITTYYFFGGAYEVRSDDTTIKYYSFGGQTILRDADGLKYFLTDHLGSVVAVTDSTGALLSQTRYLPFGLPRADVGAITQTDYGYTGQRALDAQDTTYQLGLMDYKARFYSAYLNRFTQPDTIIPGAADPQAWNRYSYVFGNPLQYIDPSGHGPICDEEGNCYDRGRGSYRGTRSDAAPDSIHVHTVPKLPIRTSNTETYTPVLNNSLSSSPTSTPLVSQSTATSTVCLTPPPGGLPNCHVPAAFPDSSSELESMTAEVVSTALDVGENMNWWHVPFVVGFGFDAYSQYTLDKGKGYSFWQMAARVGSVGIEGQIITTFSAIGTGITGVSFLGLGTFDAVVMIGTYLASNAILSNYADTFNKNTLFPAIGGPIQ